MRFFIFPLENIYIAVAADRVKRFISTENSDDSALVDHINIPVYMIFGRQQCSETMSQHGIVLKQETCTSFICGGNKTFVIITPPVERDIDVAENEIQSLPGTFSGIYSSFNGLYFNEQKIIFFLDVEKLISLWMKKSGHSGQVSG